MSLTVEDAVNALKKYLIKNYPSGVNCTTLIGPATSRECDYATAEKALAKLSKEKEFVNINGFIFFEGNKKNSLSPI